MVEGLGGYKFVILGLHDVGCQAFELSQLFGKLLIPMCVREVGNHVVCQWTVFDVDIYLTLVDCQG